MYHYMAHTDIKTEYKTSKLEKQNKDFNESKSNVNSFQFNILILNNIITM